jgi:hypothetical protein
LISAPPTATYLLAVRGIGRKVVPQRHAHGKIKRGENRDDYQKGLHLT